MKVLAADRFESIGVEGLQQCGCEVVVDQHLSGESLISAISEHDPDVLVVRSTGVARGMIMAGSALSLIVRAGAGVNTIDIEAASEKGVFVANCPGMNSAAVAELVFGLMISLDRRIAHNVSDLRDGSWNKAEYSKARGLKGSTLGVVGLGSVGREVATRARAFDMRVLYTDVCSHPEFEREHGIEKIALDDLLRQSDYVTLHVPLADGTRKLIDEPKLRLMKPSAHIINTSRGEVIDQHALVKALEQGWIAGAGLDVYEQEPSKSKDSFADPVVGMKELYGTHHIGAATAQAQTAVAEETVRIVRTYKQTGHVPNCVNTSEPSSARLVLVVRHYNKPGILAHILGHLNAVNINVEEMGNIVFAGARTCCAHIRLDDEPSEEIVDKIRNHDQILSTSLITLANDG